MQASTKDFSPNEILQSVVIDVEAGLCVSIIKCVWAKATWLLIPQFVLQFRIPTTILSN